MRRRSSRVDPVGVAWRERLGLIAILVGLALLLSYTNWLWRLDQVLYDAQLRLWSRPAPDDIVIVAIDEASLARFGRWPWRRGLHAQLLDRLHAEQPRAIALDIIFAEPDHNDPQGDAALASAIRRSGRVVVPVLMEQDRSAGQPIETLPLPMFATAAAGLGHVHVELDPDGIARSLYLHEGLGQAFWPHLSLVALAVGGDPIDIVNPVHRISPMLWARANPMRIPFAGPPGHFQRIAYAQVIDGEFTPGSLRDKYVIVGTTAAGLGDALPTPVSGYSHTMPGVEINANILSALRDGLRIEPLSETVQLFLSGLLAALPILLYPLLAPRNALLLAAGLIICTFAAGTAVLWFAHVWFAPSAALLALILSYPLWSWRRLEQAVRYLNQELDALTEQRKALAITRALHLQPAVRFLAGLLPITGWSLLDAQGQPLAAADDTPASPAEPISDDHWTLTGNSLWRCIGGPQGNRQLGLSWRGDTAPTAAEHALLDQLADAMSRATDAQDTPPALSVELLQARITQVQAATRQLQELRAFVDNSLSNMSDGVLVTDSLGQVLIANARAGWYLRGADNAQLTGLSLTDLLDDLVIRDHGSWSPLLQIALLEHTRVQAAVRHRDGRDLLVQIAPLTPASKRVEGLILNLSDISPLTASERKRDELLHFLSHDLRAPLVSLLALLELARNKTSIDEIHTELQRMVGYTEKTLNLAEQFLHLARAEGAQELPFYDVDLVNVVMNACEQVWAQAQTRGIRIEQHIDVDEAWVHGDGTLLERALVNLLTNAVKFSNPASRVTVSLTQENGSYQCCVQDEGPGIPAEDLPRLFDRFQRVHRHGQRDQDGVGLGLAFVDAAIRRHGGTVEVQSAEGHGARFCIHLTAALET